MAGNTSWIAVDWGTSNLRAWPMTDDGTPLEALRSDRGMRGLAPTEFAPTLAALMESGRALLPEGPVPTLVAGMAGARGGWQEVPYLPAPLPLSEIASHAEPVTDPTGRFAARIVPGVSFRADRRADVMRSEETQLLGFAALQPGFEGLMCMPGTHAKWVQLESGRLMGFETAMTGEVYAILAEHSVLQRTVGGAETEPDMAGFDAGAQAGLSQPGKLLRNLFQARAQALFTEATPAWCAGYLSGVLIGADVAASLDAVGRQADVPLLGAPGLCKLYARAFQLAGIATTIHDAGEATLAGLTRIHRQLSEVA